MDQDLLSIPQRGAWHILQANGCRQAHKLFVFEIYESYESFGEFGKVRYYIVGDSKEPTMMKALSGCCCVFILFAVCYPLERLESWPGADSAKKKKEEAKSAKSTQEVPKNTAGSKGFVG